MAARTLSTINGPPPNANTATEAPNTSLYLTNLPDTLQKQDLRMSLYMLFSTYGPVLDVVALKTAKMRGQAHIVFRDVQASTQAMRALQGFGFFGKEMKIRYAKGRSKVFNKLEGEYKPPNAATGTVLATEAQQSIFHAPLPGTSSLPTAPVRAPDAASNASPAEGEAAHGVKRARDDDSDEGEAPMEEDDDDVDMEASSDED